MHVIALTACFTLFYHTDVLVKFYRDVMPETVYSLSTYQSTPSLVNFVRFNGTKQKKEGQ